MHKVVLKFFLLISIPFLMSSNLFAFQKEDFSIKIDSLIHATIPRSFNGVILLSQKGKTKYLKAFGFSNFEKKIKLKTNDNFIIMSNSKQITAVLILKEVEKGTIDLHSPIKKYLPYLKQRWADTVTVHQLLNFSAGITEIDSPLIFKPGTDFKYGNTCYVLLGKIIEKVKGRSYIKVANDLFKELQMYNTTCRENGKKQNVVLGYNNTNNSLELIENQQENNEMVPAAGIISNVKDLNSWDSKLHKGKILKPETYHLMTDYSITAQHSAFGAEKIGYGYGVRISDKTPIKYIGHTGCGSGFVSFKIYFPELDVDLVVLENQSNDNMDLMYDFEVKLKEIILNSYLLQK